jgi:NAD(P)-dependent dehydrogenase (short-subunit alcohol dehydrogenase family)
MTGNVAIVTGAANGLGRAIAIRLSEEGATIVAADIDEGNGREVVDELKKNDRQASFVKLDLKDEKDVKSMVAKMIEKYKKIDILVNNAGIGKPAPLWEMPTDVWDETMAINLRGSFL